MPQHDKFAQEHNLTKTWANTTLAGPRLGYHISSAGDQRPNQIWDEYHSNFSGKVLEIGAVNGFLAKHILKNNDVEYSILDIELHHDFLRREIGASSIEKYYSSKKYEEIFKQEWDMLIETFALSETPERYWKDILKNIKTKNCFIIDYSGHDDNFEPFLREWATNKFEDKVIFYDKEVDGANKANIPVIIGKKGVL